MVAIGITMAVLTASIATVMATAYAIAMIVVRMIRAGIEL
jgi:hypothetical protein